MMKKIGILTFHYADNFGAVLQCYALREQLNAMEGIRAEVINYIPPNFRYVPCYVNTYQKRLFYQKKVLFWDFLREHCEVSTPVCHRVTGKGFDICCVGSDQIWNIRGECEEYFLPHISKGIRKIAYGASVGCAPEYLYRKKDWIAERLSDFSAISVREHEHVGPIRMISGRPCMCVADPTLLAGSEVFDALLKTEKEEEPYLLFYWLEHDDELMRGAELANMVARKYGLKVKHSIFRDVGRLLFPEGECMFFAGVQEFVQMVKYASFVVTNSYHGTIFSVLYHRPFYSFSVASMASRTATLKAALKLGDRVVDRMLSWDEITDEVDFEIIDENLKEKRRESRQFLQGALGATS